MSKAREIFDGMKQRLRGNVADPDAIMSLINGCNSLSLYAQKLEGEIEVLRERETYIAHAANAYPRLVEALALIERSGTFKGGTSIEELQSIARAALRELGEEG